MVDGLRSCPYCKKVPSVQTYKSTYGCCSRSYVECNGQECGLRGPECGTEEEAIEAWNEIAEAMEAHKGDSNQCEFTCWEVPKGHVYFFSCGHSATSILDDAPKFCPKCGMRIAEHSENECNGDGPICEYCNGTSDEAAYLIYQHQMDFDAGVDARIDGGNLVVSGFYDSWKFGSIGIAPQSVRIDYCPMCGRVLSHRHRIGNIKETESAERSKETQCR